MGLAGPGQLVPGTSNQQFEEGDETLLYTYTTKRVHVWSLNYLTEFWAHAYTPVRALTLVGGPLSHSSGPPLPRMVALGEDHRCPSSTMKSLTNDFKPMKSANNYQHFVSKNLEYEIQNELMNYKYSNICLV